MHGRLHAYLYLVVTAMVLGMSSPKCGNATAPDEPIGEAHVRATLAKALPEDYTEEFAFALGSMDGKQTALVCATSPSWPGRRGPWASGFLVCLSGAQPEMLWAQTYPRDWACWEAPRVLGEDGDIPLLVLSTRRSAASVRVGHVRLYSYPGSRTTPRPLSTIEIVDGGFAIVPELSGKWPVFLVYEPTYEDWPKYTPQRYAFRVYSPTRHATFRISGTVTTLDRYDGPADAYRELKPRIEELIGSRYQLPAVL